MTDYHPDDCPGDRCGRTPRETCKRHWQQHLANLKADWPVLYVDRRPRRQRGEPLHLCNVSCGIAFDPLCPTWSDDPAPAFDPETCARLLMTLRSPSYRRELRIVLRELLAEDMADIALVVVREVRG